ncbi:TolC family protein [Metallumcola ferriviriculae]|uniref:TolC family protein n=1 Tax=Metallumcola ferriviriculae TaxID=3039180 RepID=A0AAU0UKW1_9FIRM|nr:TolC family protein [Desulfitibacteraceae bacterium MK1]
MKRLVILAMVAMLVMGSVAGTSLAGPAEEKVMVLSLDEAIDYALEHNSNIQLNKVSLDEAEKDFNQANDLKEKIADNPDSPYFPPGLSTAQQEELYPTFAERGYEFAKVKLDYTKRSIRLSVESTYYNVLSAQKNVAVNQATHDRAAEQLKSAKAAFKAGTVAKNDVLGAEVQLDKATVDLNTAENDLDIAYMELNRAMGLELDQTLELTAKLDYASMEEIDVAEFIDQASDADIGLIAARIDYENKQDAFELTADYYTPNVYTYKDAKFATAKSEVNFQEAQKDFELKVMKSYKRLKQAEANYKMLLKSVDRAKENLRLAELRYEVGVATSIEVLQASEMLNSQELYLSQALQGYNLLKAQFKHQVFIGSGAAASAGAGQASGM